jgi:hypothetical protein
MNKNIRKKIIALVIANAGIAVKAISVFKDKYNAKQQARYFCYNLAYFFNIFLDNKTVENIPKVQLGKINRITKILYNVELKEDELYPIFSYKPDTNNYSKIKNDKIINNNDVKVVLIDWIVNLIPPKISVEKYYKKILESGITVYFGFSPDDYKNLKNRLKEKKYVKRNKGIKRS